MKRIRSCIILLAVISGLYGCDDMHDQVSIKPQEAPRRSTPSEAVPIQGKETVTWQSQLNNPVSTSDFSVQRGKEIYMINCALCHGTPETQPGAVGRKLVPPPPNLQDPRIKALNDSDVFKRISLGFGRMPAFQLVISATDRWHLVNYLHTF